MRGKRGKPTFRVENGCIVITSEYNTSFITQIKSRFNDGDIEWDGKSWWIRIRNRSDWLALNVIVFDTIGGALPSPSSDLYQFDPKRQLRDFEVYYVGSTRIRKNGSDVAFGYVKREDQCWYVVFPKSVLKRFFGASTEPEENVDLFALLGVPKTATQAELKYSYRELAKRYHPDVNSADSETFIRINEAYSVLSDPQQRTIYTASLKWLESAEIEEDKEEARDLTTYTPPKNCGVVRCVGYPLMSRFMVENILDWKPIVSKDGRTLFTYWVQDDVWFTEEWI